MSIRVSLSVGLISAALALAGVARGEEATKPPAAPGSAPQECAHHMRAMHGMQSDKQREAYCHAHEDCMRRDCGGMGMKGRGMGQGPVDEPAPEAKPQPPKK
jgi:hypothetical protein